jgi:hypothetical protein
LVRYASTSRLEEVLEIQPALSSEPCCCAHSFQSLCFSKLVHRQIDGYVVDLLCSARVGEATPISTTNVAKMNRAGVAVQSSPGRSGKRILSRSGSALRYLPLAQNVREATIAWRIFARAVARIMHASKKWSGKVGRHSMPREFIHINHPKDALRHCGKRGISLRTGLGERSEKRGHSLRRWRRATPENQSRPKSTEGGPRDFERRYFYPEQMRGGLAHGLHREAPGRSDLARSFVFG